MLAVFAVLLGAVTILLFAAAAIAYRKAERAKWLNWPIVEHSVAIVFTVGLTAALMMLAQAAFTFDSKGMGAVGAVEGLAIAAIVVVSVLIWRRMRVVETLRALDALAAERKARAAEEPTPPKPAAGMGRKRAA